ncbi:MAG: helix-turn-helix transcriptional regulator [Formivibrio sp.]|nr:helix-turn-helix transcriptional regulator [Formivibrio sp.]
MKSLAERLKWARSQKNLSQTALAKIAGVSQSTIGNLESGDRLSARKIAVIASALNVDALWLAEGKGASPEAPHRGDDAAYAQAVQPAAHPDNFVDADEFVKLMILFRQSTASGRRQIMGAAESADKAISAGGDLAAEN